MIHDRLNAAFSWNTNDEISYYIDLLDSKSVPFAGIEPR